MIFRNNGFLSLHIITDLQTELFIASDYFTHMKLVCQPICLTASYIIVLSIIPPV
jgi:hypothetical protein